MPLSELFVEGMTALQQSAWAAGLRASLWLYPLIAALHLLGIALLIGPILVHHAAVLGLAFADHAQVMSRVMPRVSAIGLAMAVGSGALLWSARALEYSMHPVFQLKMVVLLVALTNIVVVHRLASRAGIGSRAMSIGALVSGLAWLSVLMLGRLIGYR